MPNPTDRLENLLQLARATVHRDDRVAVYRQAMAVALHEFKENGGRKGGGIPGLGTYKVGIRLTSVDHNLLTWTFYTSDWYWAAANSYRMGQRDLRAVPGKMGKKMGVWLTKDMARRANIYTSHCKDRGAMRRHKVWEDWWQSFKKVHADISAALERVTGGQGPRSPASYWGDVYVLLGRCRLAAERGATWPKHVPAESVAAKERAPTKAVPVAKMVKKGRPNRVCADGMVGITRWRFSRSYRAMAEALGVGELDPNGRNVWLAEGLDEHTAVATAVKAKNANISIALS